LTLPEVPADDWLVLYARPVDLRLDQLELAHARPLEYQSTHPLAFHSSMAALVAIEDFASAPPRQTLGGRSGCVLWTSGSIHFCPQAATA
jgi:hypothetical protein